MKLVTDSAVLAKAIKSIAVRGQKLDHDIHVAGTSCLQHIANHSDTTLLNDLVDALPKGARKHAFNEYELEQMYNEFLADCYPTVNVCGYDFDPSRALKELDPTAYRCGFLAWCDQEGYDID